MRRRTRGPVRGHPRPVRRRCPAPRVRRLRAEGGYSFNVKGEPLRGSVKGDGIIAHRDAVSAGRVCAVRGSAAGHALQDRGGAGGAYTTGMSIADVLVKWRSDDGLGVASGTSRALRAKLTHACQRWGWATCKLGQPATTLLRRRQAQRVEARAPELSRTRHRHVPSTCWIEPDHRACVSRTSTSLLTGAATSLRDAGQLGGRSSSTIWM